MVVDFSTLAHQCAPSVAIATIAAVVSHESRRNPFAIGVNGGTRISRQPANKTEAVELANKLLGMGLSIDLGLAQINSKNLSWLGLSLREVFEPCTNLGAASRILQDGYGRSDAGRVGEQAALKTALSYYNTGDPIRGISNGYVGKVTAAAARIVPAIGGASLPSALGSRPEAPQEPPLHAWDVFGEAPRVRSTFVMTLTNSAAGGSQ